MSLYGDRSSRPYHFRNTNTGGLSSVGAHQSSRASSGYRPDSPLESQISNVPVHHPLPVHPPVDQNTILQKCHLRRPPSIASQKATIDQGAGPSPVKTGSTLTALGWGDDSWSFAYYEDQEISESDTFEVGRSLADKASAVVAKDTRDEDGKSKAAEWKAWLRDRNILHAATRRQGAGGKSLKRYALEDPGTGANSASTRRTRNPEIKSRPFSWQMTDKDSIPIDTTNRASSRSTNAPTRSPATSGHSSSKEGTTHGDQALAKGDTSETDVIDWAHPDANKLRTLNAPPPRSAPQAKNDAVRSTSCPAAEKPEGSQEGVGWSGYLPSGKSALLYTVGTAAALALGWHLMSRGGSDHTETEVDGCDW